MKKLLPAITLITLFSCSKEEDCDAEVERIMNMYEEALDEPLLGDRQRQLLLDERAEALAKACN